MIIQLPETVTKSTPLKMYDQLGKVVNETQFEKGENTRTMNTSELSGGVYLIQIETEKGVLRRKVMVLHEN